MNMTKNFFSASFLMALLLLSTNLKAEPNALGYENISPAQPTQDSKKVEIIEFFWYGCPHCLKFEPLLNKWKESLPENVQFIRQPAIFSSVWGKHAKLYFTAEALGVVDNIHSDLFDAIQNKKQKLTKEDDAAKFFVARGIDDAKFREAYNSFLVDSKMRQAKAMAPRYGITGVPAVIINGKYKTNGPIAGSHEKMLEVMNTLIKQENASLAK